MRILSTAALLVCTIASLRAAPAIAGVTNSASNIPPGLPNSGIAQGSIFAVYGSALGPATLQQALSFPLPSTQGLAGTTVTATVNGATTTCIMFYTSANQVAALLPSATPVGNGTLTVSYQGASGSIPIQVLAAGFGTYALNESGTGPAVITDLSYSPITMINPAHPGQTLILWGTGLGPVSGDETEPQVSTDLGSGVQVIVENQAGTVLYGGRSGDPGLDQINFTVPAGITGGCRTSVAILEKGLTGNVTTMAVAPAGQSTCGDQVGILTTANLRKAASTGTLNVGFGSLYRFGTESDTFDSQFVSYPVSSLIRSYGGSLAPSFGSCSAYESLGSSTIVDPIQPSFLNAGPSESLTGPVGTKSITQSGAGLFSTTLGAAGSFIAPGAFTLGNGSGGTGIGAFSWNLTLPSPLTLTLPSPLTLTNLPTEVNRSRDLTVTWTNSSAFAAVSIFGISGVPQSSGQTAYVEFFCSAQPSTGQFTIPSVILGLLPANGYGATGKAGVAIEVGGVVSDNVSATGLDAAIFSAFTYNGSVLGVE